MHNNIENNGLVFIFLVFIHTPNKTNNETFLQWNNYLEDFKIFRRYFRATADNYFKC